MKKSSLRRKIGTMTVHNEGALLRGHIPSERILAHIHPKLAFRLGDILDYFFHPDSQVIPDGQRLPPIWSFTFFQKKEVGVKEGEPAGRRTGVKPAFPMASATCRFRLRSQSSRKKKRSTLFCSLAILMISCTNSRKCSDLKPFVLLCLVHCLFMPFQA